MCIEFKKASSAHCELLYLWRNEITTRENSFNNEKIDYNVHIEWYKKLLNDRKVFQYIVYKKNNPVGQIRLMTKKNRGEISFSIDIRYRGKGYGTVILCIIKDIARSECNTLEIYMVRFCLIIYHRKKFLKKQVLKEMK
jgi:RimJ/RimL family protein N-acetyltransferase